MMLLEVSGLRKEFSASGPPAVDDVSFSIPAGGALGLIGESGSGKTTIARMILGLEKPTSGSIAYEGQAFEPWNPRRLSRKDRAKRTQIVFQDPYLSLNPRLTVGESVESVLRLHGSDRGTARRRCDELLAQVGLGARERGALPAALSGGQRQRAAIARSLAVEPKLLILDEAVAALDVSVQAQILNLLNDLRREQGVAYLFITHNLAVVRYVTDEAIVLQRGQSVEAGPTAELLERPRHEYTRRLIASVPGQARG